MNKKYLMIALLLVGAVSGYGAVVAAWDLTDHDAGTVATGWTTFDNASYTNVLLANRTSTIGGLTLENTSYTFKVGENKAAPVAEYDPALLASNEQVTRDWFDMDGDQVLTLTGLTPGQEYRFQFTGTIQQKLSTGPFNRNIEVTLDDVADTTALLYDDPISSGDGFQASYSQYFTFTATAGDTEVVMTFSEDGGGKKGISGLIVEEVEEGFYPLSITGGSGSGFYTNGEQVVISADEPAPGKEFSNWIGDTQYVASVTSATTTVTMSTNAVELTARFITPALDGTVVAAWDFGSSRDGGVPAGWTTWSNEDLVTNGTASTIGGLTLTHSSTNTAAPFASTIVQQIDSATTTGVWGYVNAPLLDLDTGSASQSVYEDFINRMTTPIATKFTLSGLTIGETYQIQFVSIFSPYEGVQVQLITQGGIAATTISSAGVGSIDDHRVIYSDYYDVIATASNSVVFEVDGSSTGNAGKNGLAGMIVKLVSATGSTAIGTPYAWLDQYGLTDYEADELLDQDEDGLLTWQEYIAGTVPTNKASSFVVTLNPVDVVNWTAVPGRIYEVYWSDNLQHTPFTSLSGDILPPQSSYTNTTPGAQANFYQMKVRLP